MKLTVDRKELASGIKDVARAASSHRTTLPILSNILLQASEEDGLKLSATDLEISVTRTIKADVTQGGSTTVSAKTLSDLVGVAGNGDQANIRLLKNESLKLTMGNITSKLKGISSDDFPPMPLAPDSDPISFRVDELKEAIKLTTLAASKDEGRPVLQGILFEFGESELVMAAADGYRLSVLKSPLPKGFTSNGDGPTKAIIPAKALKQLSTALANREYVDLHLEETKAIFVTSDMIFAITLVNGVFPDYEAIVPTTHATHITTTREAFLKSAQAANVFASQASNLVKLEVDPEFQGGFQMSALANEIGSNETAVAASEVGGKSLEVGFNAKWIIELLKANPGETVIFESAGKNLPGLFRFEENPDFVHVLMPMHLPG